MADDEEMEGTELISFGLISTAGTAKSMAMNAIKCAREGDLAGADDQLEQMEGPSLEAHNAQTDLLMKEAQGDHVLVDVLLVHAQDHLMGSILAGELAKEIVALYKKIDALEARIADLEAK